jgi:DeoR family transcriptional regulator of aga operon
MLAEERRSEILRLIQSEGRVHVKELSQRFRTSEVTIRQDLRGLKERGLIRRAHGGALPLPEIAAESPLLDRAQMHAGEKGRIAAAAAALIEDGETIVLDSGTTTQEIARRIKGRQQLRVITNGVNIASELLGLRNIEVIMLGGVLRQDSFSIVGHVAEEMLNEFAADKLFMGAAACDSSFGPSTPTLDEARVNQAMVRSARRRILVADSSKFGKRSLCRIVPMHELHTVISDTGLAEHFQQQIRAAALELILA